jgi:hypothetical protein
LFEKFGGETRPCASSGHRGSRWIRTHDASLITDLAVDK